MRWFSNTCWRPPEEHTRVSGSTKTAAADKGRGGHGRGEC
jgi:hypothetical protein